MRRSVVLAVLLPLLAPAPAAAQKAKTTMVRGTVIADNGDPIPRAEVFFVGTALRAITRDDGSFQFDTVPAGRYWFGTRRIGYVPVATSVTIDAGKPRLFRVELEALPANLTPVEVRASSGYDSGPMAEFGRRRRVAWGHFITKDDIARERPHRISWMVQRYMPWVRFDVFDYAAFSSFTERRHSFAGRQANCAPGISVNGGIPWGGWAVNDFQPDEVEALEIYAGRSTRLPIEFQHSPYTACGLVVVWLKR